MKHKIGYNKLGRKSQHRKSLHRNMVTSLFRYEKITTTRAKAMEIRKTAEKMVTRAKDDTIHNRRIIARNIQDKAVLAKLFTELGPRYKARMGGYTRVLKLGKRYGDASEMVILEMVDRPEAEEPVKEKTKKKKAVEEKAASEDEAAENSEGKKES